MKTYILILSIVLYCSSLLNSQNPSDREIQKIDSLLESIYDNNEPGGAVAVVKNGKIIYKKGFGLASIELKVANSSKSVIQIGSITKQFTATAILKLCEEGKIALSDDIRNYIPGIDKNRQKISIDQLLSHTSGIVDLFELPEWFNTWAFEYSPNELFEIFKDKDLLSPPGEKHHYSNAGYVLLGMIIEKVSAKSYSDYLKEIIFDPLDMNQTCIYEEQIIIPNRASGHQVTSKGFVRSPFINPSHYFAGGSIMSSVVDLAKWNSGLSRGLIINDTSLSKAISKYKLNDGSFSNYGFGFNIGKMMNTLLIDHGGSTIGSNCHDLWFPKDSLYIIVLNNSIAFMGSGIKEKYDSRKICIKLAKICYHQATEQIQLQSLSKEEFENYQGVYNDNKGKARVIYQTDSAFYWTNSTGRRFEISYIGEDSFIFEDETKLSFEKEGTKIIRAVLLIGDDTYYYTKTELPLPKPKERKQISEALYDQVTGKYSVGLVFKTEISKGDNSLIVDVSGMDQSIFYLEDNLKFFKSDEELITITFTKNKKAEVDGFVINLVNREMNAKKKK